VRKTYHRFSLERKGAKKNKLLPGPHGKGTRLSEWESARAPGGRGVGTGKKKLARAAQFLGGTVRMTAGKSKKKSGVGFIPGVMID